MRDYRVWNLEVQMTANGRSSFSTTQFYFHSTLIALALVALAKERHICALQQELHDLLRSKSQAGLCSTNPSLPSSKKKRKKRAWCLHLASGRRQAQLSFLMFALGQVSHAVWPGEGGEGTDWQSKANISTELLVTQRFPKGDWRKHTA